jgi:hypothetical protein
VPQIIRGRTVLCPRFICRHAVCGISQVAIARAQQVQTGQGGTAAPAGGNQGAGTTSQAGAAGQFNPGASSAARAAMPGQSGTISDFGPVAPQQGQFFPNGQPVSGRTAGVGRFSTSGQFFPGGQINGVNQFSDGQFTAGQAGATGHFTTGGQLITGNQFPPGGAATQRFNQVFGNGTIGAGSTAVFNTPTPWFNSGGARQQLGLSPNQYQNLYSAYVNANTRYNEAVAQLPASMVAAERAGRLQALQEVFGAEFNQALGTVFPSAQQLQKFNDLSSQLQNRAAGNQPANGRAVGLTPEQGRRLRLMANQWNQLAQQVRERDRSTQDLDKLNEEAQMQIESTLTPEQLPYWRELVSGYYEFGESEEM